jgi:hypothetical protein
MSPELINAIKERLTAGQTREEIETAVLAMGHTREVFDAAYTLAQHDEKQGKAGALPRVKTLFFNSWNFATSHPELIALLFIPLLLETLVSFWFGYNPNGNELPPLPLIGSFIVLGLVYMATLATALYIVAKSPSETVSLKGAALWMVKHILPLLFVFVLSGLVIFGGFMLLFIPGIIAAIAVTFAQYAFISDEKRGMDALLASRHVVSGRWFLVVRKICGFIFFSIIPMLVLGVAYGIFQRIVGEGEYVVLAGEILTQLLSAVMSLMSLHAMFHLYQALRASSTEAPVSKKIRISYWFMASIGILFVISIGILAVFYREMFMQLEDAAMPLEELETKEVPASFSSFKEVALRYANEHTGSYEGVCEVLKPLAAVDGEVACNDHQATWALAVTNTFGTRFCADVTTPGKQVYTELGEKTQCITVEQ